MDALRGIEAISTVSGGSILGAHYYLEVQNLLRSTTDRDITREDYIGIVHRVQKNFLQGVQTNIKMQTFASLKDNWDFLSRSKDYSRSHRLGEFYESKLYRKIGENDENDQSRTMPQLAFTPADVQNAASFKPKFSNWVRRARVPAIILNATSLNSGHNWQFTAHSMGEPPSHILGEIDSMTYELEDTDADLFGAQQLTTIAFVSSLRRCQPDHPGGAVRVYVGKIPRPGAGSSARSSSR